MVMALDELADILPDERYAPSRNDEEIGKSISIFLNKQKEVVRRVFLLKYFYFESNIAIAERCGFTERKVTHMLAHTRAQLKRISDQGGNLSMNIPKIADAIGYIDNELITATLEAPPKKRHNPVMKWMTAAACLTLFVIAGILIPHLLKNDATAESKYKYHVSKTERAIEWPWKYKTPAEKYPVVKFNGNSLLRKVRILFIQR